MYNKEMFKKICNVACSFEELEAFTIKIDKKEFDLEKPFEKYYDLKKILFAIQRYEKKEIDDKFLAYWMNAFNWIIMGGFKIKPKDNSITFKEWLEWEICDWLDSLSFFDASEDWYHLEDYKTAFAVLDKIYRNSNDWDADVVADISLRITEIITAHDTVDWHDNKDIHNKIAQDIDDMFYELEKECGLKLDFDTIDKIIENVITVALRRFK